MPLLRPQTRKRSRVRRWNRSPLDSCDPHAVPRSALDFGSGTGEWNSRCGAYMRLRHRGVNIRHMNGVHDWVIIRYML